MKVLATICFLLIVQRAPASPDTVARTGEQVVLSVYKSMEDADRRGDGELWLSLRDRKTRDSMNQAVKDALRKGGHSRPNVQYLPIAVRVVKDRAVILGKVADPDGKTEQYEAVLLTVEEGGWKVGSEQWSEKPLDPFLMYAMLEPEEGSFARAGSPWKPVPYAKNNGEMVRKDDVVWKIQGTFDETSVYVRFETAAPVPAAGAKIRPDVGKAGKTGGPPPPPPMRIKVSAPGGAASRELSIGVSALVATTDTTDPKGKPAKTYAVTYSLFVKNGDGEEVFESTLGDGASSHMLTVHDRYLEVKIPLGAFGVNPVPVPKVDLEEADSMVLVLPYHVEAFGAR
ncbi:MAG TPA: hypothetical protein VKU19_05965 [Bryobacteraceae bacterium]|nr:hypothetical protein [Bryobacteraceae bacterium]